MKTPILTLMAGLLLALLGACHSTPSVVTATGMPYEVVVVTPPANWNDTLGAVLKEELRQPILGLPQPEPTMRITYTSPEDFNGLMTYVRNILIVDIDGGKYTRLSLRSEKDRWASGQTIVYFTAPNEMMLVDYLKLHQGVLTDYFTRLEMARMAQVMQETYSSRVMDKVKTKFDVMLNVPSDITSDKDTTDFYWASNNANTGRMDVVVYTFPYTDANTFSKEYLAAMRDSILGANIPGAFPNSHMTTVPFGLSYEAKKLQGKYCGVLRGLWKMEGDMMGGPFVSYARLDETNNRIVVAEGFVYAPETDKRNYIRRLEASLHTLRLPGEFDKPLDTVGDMNENTQREQQTMKGEGE
ncbi:DUF4837 family protein [Tannerella sp.]|uniref:DUF4837 family protein n=1 Tax=Tannerella sp. TaxID=2382127 RepID=UPI0026DC9D5C|nr:DUF4837 family protein [Tannerella sp.]MDO4703644.1 DUF4837 family protein [Tannerella sp.]